MRPKNKTRYSLRTLLSTSGFSLMRETGGTVPMVPFVQIKNAILKKKYDLTLSFVSPTRGKALHKKWKSDGSLLNILSFPYDASSGEIVMTLSAARSEAKKFDMTYHQYLTFLFIHGCVHLLGYDHGKKMETLEATYLKKFNVPNPYH